MSKDVYGKLREFLDKMPGGYPTTETGVEIKILKKLFNPQEAETTMNLTAMPEGVPVIAERLKMDENEASMRLESIAKRGLILRVRLGDDVFYMANSFIIGIFEFSINSIDREFSELMEKYSPYLAKSWENVPTKQLRIVPIGSSIDATQTVSTYDRIRDLVKDKELISVAPCICAMNQELLSHPCDRPKERCIQFDIAAQYYLENKMARQINMEELMELLKMGEEKALVISPTNAKDIVNICMCCGCCCEFLGSLKKMSQPADQIQSSFFAQIDQELCIICGTCEDRCQMEAIKENDEYCEVDTARCIGCALCVTTCPEEAISLVNKPELTPPPENIIEMNIKISKERGIL